MRRPRLSPLSKASDAQTTSRGLKFVSAKRTERIRAIADYICQPAAQGESPTSSTASRDGESLPLSASNTSQSNDHQTGSRMHSEGTAGSRWDIVCLQELWCSEDWDYVQARCKHSGSGLVHGRYFYRCVGMPRPHAGADRALHIQWRPRIRTMHTLSLSHHCVLDMAI